jgi:hypothetical protein
MSRLLLRTLGKDSTTSHLFYIVLGFLYKDKRRVGMSERIKITAGGLTLDAELFDTPCARAIAGALPIRTAPSEWGDEFYFEIPVEMPLDQSATTEVKAGDIGYWPPGKALAIFFGPTPMSSGPDPVPASAVNSVGAIHGDAAALKKAKGAREIRIERAE